MCKLCCFQVTSLPLLTFLLLQLPAAKVVLVARVKEPRKSCSCFLVCFLGGCTLFPCPRRGQVLCWEGHLAPVLSLPIAVLPFPAVAGWEQRMLRWGGCHGSSPACVRSVGLMRCDSSAELLTRGAAWGYFWKDKAGGHQAGGQPEMSAAKSRSSLGFLGWIRWKIWCLVKVRGKPPWVFWFVQKESSWLWLFSPVSRSRLSLVAGISLEDSGPSSDFSFCVLWPHSLGAAQMLIFTWQL